MTTAPAIPDLEQRFLEPQNWNWGSFQNKQGATLRYGSALPDKSPRAHVIILPGRTEFIEKYFETAHDLLSRGYAAWIMDWQGQGKSQRQKQNPERGHTPPFETHLSDLGKFINGHVQANGAPLIMLAQSMGGNIGLQYLQQHPGIFSAAAFCAPMLGIKSAPRWLRPLANMLGTYFKSSYAFAQKDWARAERQILGKYLTSDKKRSRIHDAWMLADPALRVGGATFGWVHEALNACEKTRPAAFLKSVTTPFLIARAGHEILVDNKSMGRAASLIPHAKLLDFPDAGHEILMERDEIRNRFFAEFEKLVSEALPGGAAS